MLLIRITPDCLYLQFWAWLFENCCRRTVVRIVQHESQKRGQTDKRIPINIYHLHASDTFKNVCDIVQLFQESFSAGHKLLILSEMFLFVGELFKAAPSYRNLFGLSSNIRIDETVCQRE